MPDVLDNEPRPLTRWLMALGLVGALVVVIALVSRAPEPVSRSSPSPAPSRVLPPGSVAAAALPTPAQAGSACGGDVTLPLVSAATRPAGTRLRLLVGDRDLRLVDVDAGTSSVLNRQRDGRSFTAMTGSGGRVLAVLQDRCTPKGFGDGQVVTLNPLTGLVSHSQPGDELLPGSPPTVVDYDADGSSYLRDVDGTTRIRVPDRWLPLARRGATYFVFVQASQADMETQGVGALGTILIGDPGNARIARELGSGGDIAASESKVVWLAGGCDPGPCLLAVTGQDGVASAQGLNGRRPWSGAISSDGSKVAFRLTRTEGRLGQHPGPPNDVAVLDIRTGKLRVLPGLVLPAKAGLTLTWSPNSEWLVLGADLGTGPLVLIWRAGMERPARVLMPPTRGGTTGPPALLVL